MNIMIELIGIMLSIPAFYSIKQSVNKIPILDGSKRYRYFAYTAISILCIVFSVGSSLLIIKYSLNRQIFGPIAFVGSMHVISYFTFIYKGYVCRMPFKEAAKEVKELLIKTDYKCSSCGKKISSNISIDWDFSKQLLTNDDLKNAIVIKNACCEYEESFIRHSVMKSLLQVVSVNNFECM